MKKEKKYLSQKVMELRLISGWNTHHLKVFHCICIKIQKEQKKLYKEIVPKTVDEYLDL